MIFNKRKARNDMLEWAKKILKKEDEVKKAQKLVRAKAFDTSHAFGRALEGKGFKALGCGAFSTVYAIPGNNKQVIKICHKPERDGWLEYIKWAKENGYDGKFCPKVYSYKWINTRFSTNKRHAWEDTKINPEAPPETNGFGIAIMDRLQMNLQGREAAAQVGATEHVLFKMAGEFQNKWAAKALEDLRPGMVEFAQKLYEKFDKNLDLHSGNFMLNAEGRLLVTDPVANLDTDPKIRIKQSVVSNSLTMAA